MIHLVIGRRKRGKTTLAYYMARNCPQRVIFDPRGMIRAAPEARVVTTMRGFQEGFRALSAAELTELVYTPADDSFPSAFRYFCACVKTWIVADSHRPLAVMIDELAFVNPTEPALLWMLRCSEPDVFHIFVTCHRPKDVPTDMRAIADRWFLFQCRQEHDLEVIEDRCSAAVAAAITRLEEREFVLWDDDTATMKVFRNAKPWHVPLKRDTPPDGQAIDLGALEGEDISLDTQPKLL